MTATTRMMRSFAGLRNGTFASSRKTPSRK
jgi:hypothetical protein